MPTTPAMRHRGRRRYRLTFIELTVKWVEVLWSCRCQYHNVARYRCGGCGSRPPRELREIVAAIPWADEELPAAS